MSLINLGLVKDLMVKSFSSLELHVLVFKCFPGQQPTMLELYNTISIFGKRYSITNDFEILSQYEIAIVDTLYEIDEVEIT